MAAFLLWNVDRKPLDGLVQDLVRQLQIDVVLLVEYAFGVSQLPSLLANDGFFRRRSPQRFGVFARADHRLQFLRYRLGQRAGLWRWTPPSGQEGLVVLLHGFDRRNYDDSTRRVFSAASLKLCVAAKRLGDTAEQSSPAILTRSRLSRPSRTRMACTPSA
jgi:hypothetical protein